MRDAATQRIAATLRATCRIRRIAACSALIAALGTTVMLPPHPRLLWNASASAPIGLWHISPGAPLRRGDMVAARLAEPWRGLAARRHYLPANVPLLKRVAAGPGDIVCALDSGILVNGKRVAGLREADGSGRPMPRWRGCIMLRDGAMLLLMDDPASFDGRYFGRTKRGDIIGKAVPLWLR